MDEQNFLTKNRKLAAKWSGPFLITKVRDNGNIRIKLEKKEINVNVNRIKPYIASIPKPEQEIQPQPEVQEQKPLENLENPPIQEEEQPWTEVKQKQAHKPKSEPAPEQK